MLLFKKKLEELLNNLCQQSLLPNEFLSEIASIEELSDGNVNQVFRVTFKNKASVIVKYAPPFAYRFQSISIVTERNAFEANVLKVFFQSNPNFYPEVYYHDPNENFFIMQDLKDYPVMRKALMEGKIFEKFSTQMVAIFCAYPGNISANNTPEGKISFKEGVPELQNITRDFVFQHPFGLKYPDGVVCLESNLNWVKENIFNNEKLQTMRAELEKTYFSKQEALLHGDLHTGSIMLNGQRTYLMDPEFARIGPISFDIGMLIANLIMSALAANYHLKDDPDEKQKFQEWILESIKFIWEKTSYQLQKKGIDINTLKAETMGYCGIEIIRRTIGAAQIKDFTSIDDMELRETIEKSVLNIAHFQLMEAKNPNVIQKFLELFQESMEAFNESSFQLSRR